MARVDTPTFLFCIKITVPVIKINKLAKKSILKESHIYIDFYKNKPFVW